MPVDSFDFRKLSETQRTAVYHHLRFSEKLELRRVAKVFMERPAHRLLFATRFDGVAVFCPCEAADRRGTEIRVVASRVGRTTFMIKLGNPVLPMEMQYYDYSEVAQAPSVLKTIDSKKKQHKFVNRLTASIPPHSVYFWHHECGYAGGCVRPYIDVLRWSIKAEHTRWTVEGLPEVLQQERETLRRQNSCVVSELGLRCFTQEILSLVVQGSSSTRMTMNIVDLAGTIAVARRLLA
ncbi:unnamed protein product, partial [Mesorhabditis spiculigera]